MLALGIDIGTTSLSLALVDADSGALIARDTVNHTSFIPGALPCGRTQDPERIAALAKERAAALIARYGRPGCIGLTGQMHGMVYVDKGGKAVSPLYTWQDGRGGLEMAGGRTYAQALTDRGLGAASAGFGLTTHFYMRENGLVPPEAAGMATISDYLGMALTGRRTPAIGADMAASWGGFDLKRREFLWDDPLLPELLTNYALMGRTPEGVPVTVSVGDNQAGVIGACRDIDDSLLLNVGTGSQISLAVHDFYDCGGAIELRPCGSGYILAGSGLCGGRAYAMLEQFYREVAGGGEPRFDLMLEQAEAFICEYGMDAIWQVRTTFSGTRSDPGERGSIAGIGVENFRPGALTAGLVLGMLEELKEAFDAMQALTGAHPGKLVGSGNGLRRNPLMQRMAEGLFGLKLLIPAHMEEAAYGAALCAMAASGAKPSLKDAQKLIRYEGE